MASEWPERRLDEVTELIVDCPHSTPKWTNSGVVVLRNQNIRNGRLDLSSPSFTDEEGYKARVKRAILRADDLVFTREAPMGEVCRIPEGIRCCLGQRMVLNRADKKVIDSGYLHYALQSPYLQHQIGWNEGTGTTVSNIRIPNIKAFQVPLPRLPEQKAIAHILGVLDDKIERYYAECAEEGASEYAIEESKKAVANMTTILGDPERIEALAADFVDHYEKRVGEGATVAGKAMFVSSSRPIAYAFYQAVIALRPEWAEVKVCADGMELTEAEAKTIKPMERIKMVMTRGKDDEAELYELLGSKEYRKELDRQFKTAKSNFKVAIVVDMWLTGFDVPFLDTIYIDKPVQRHNLIQTISRVNRKFEGKNKGLVVDYIGIKKQMNLALAHYSKADKANIEEVEQSIVVVKDHLDLLGRFFNSFDMKPYFSGSPTAQLECLNRAAEFVQLTEKIEKRFMFLVKRLKAAYDICCGSDAFMQAERNQIHFYLAVRSIVAKLTKGDAPDTAQMNAKVRAMIADALQSDGVEEIFKLGEDSATEIDIFEGDYLAKIAKIKLPNTKIKLLQQLLKKAIEEFKKVNKVKGVDFSRQFEALVRKYNERKEEDVLVSNVLEDFSDEIIDLFEALKKEKESFGELGINFEEKAFYDILLSLAHKYDFEYPEGKLLSLSKAVKVVVDDKAKYTDWSQRDDIKAELKVDLIILLAEHGYSPVDRDEVYKEIFEQAENFKKYQSA